VENERYKAVKSATVSGAYDGLVDRDTGRRVKEIDLYVSVLREQKIKPATITQRVYAIRRFLEYCARMRRNPCDSSFQPLAGYIVDDEIRRMQGKQGSADVLQKEAWRHARETSRQLLQYVASVRDGTIRDDFGYQAWSRVVEALAVAGIQKPVRGAVPSSTQVKRSGEKRWLPAFDEFVPVVARMRDPRTRVAAIVMYATQLDKETIVSVRLDDVRLSPDGRSAVLNVRGEAAFGGRTVLELPQNVMAKVEENVRRYEPGSQWLLPSYGPGHIGKPMSASKVMHMITEEARLQGIAMTCRSIRVAGAVDAVKSRHEPAEDVLQRLGGDRWKGELEKAVHTAGLRQNSAGVSKLGNRIIP